LKVDRILIDDLTVSCTIGVHAWERACRQPLNLSLGISTSARSAAELDDLSTTVDYVAVCELCTRIAREGRFQLIETLAATVADAVLAMPAVESVDVTVRKPGAVRQADAVGISLTRP
jgi:dihydroneopterin aldolase